MASDMYLKVGDVKGESVDAKHKDEIDIISWSWGISQSGTFHSGSGGGSGRSKFQDISVTKYIDKASPVLMKKCCDGTQYDEAILTVRKAGTSPLEYVIMKLNEVIITSVQTGGSGGEDRLTENVTLNFAKFTVDYQPQGTDGAPDGGSVSMGWDIPANIEM